MIYQRRGIRPPPVPVAVDEPTPCDDRVAALLRAPDAVVAEAEARSVHGTRSPCFLQMAPVGARPAFVRRRGITIWSVRITRHWRQTAPDREGKCGENWWALGDLNARPQPCEGCGRSAPSRRVPGLLGSNVPWSPSLVPFGCQIESELKPQSLRSSTWTPPSTSNSLGKGWECRACVGAPCARQVTQCLSDERVRRRFGAERSGGSGRWGSSLDWCYPYS